MDYYETVDAANKANESEFGYETFVPYFDEEEDECCHGDHHHHHHHHDGECCGGHDDGCCHDGECDECDDECCGGHDDGECCGRHRHWHNPAFATFTFAHEGANYFVRRWGKPGDVPVLMLHGFMQTGDSWWQIAPAIAQDRCVYAMDLLGHGKSDKPADVSAYSLEGAAAAAHALIREVIQPEAEAANPGRKHKVHLVGYSLGGRVALTLLARAGGDLNTVVLESSSLGPADEQEAQTVASRNQEWAAKLRNEGMQSFVDFWEQLPLFQTQQRLAASKRGKAQRAERMSQDPQAMAAVLLGMGLPTMPLKAESKDMLACCWNPVCYVYGNRDEKYAALAHDFVHEGFEARGIMAGHNSHFENPDTYVAELDNILRGNEMRGI
ncbi:MAG: alpha/beta fold hydrolase [Eggerthellaceae bacterium]